MKCIKCGNRKSRVKDSRLTKNNTQRRRRECTLCGFRFNTYEMLGMDVRKRTFDPYSAYYQKLKQKH